MSAVDLEAVREGDQVLVRGTVAEIVRSTMGASFRIALGGNNRSDQWVAGASISAVEPRQIEVGDRVFLDKGSIPHVLLAIDNKVGFLRAEDNGGHYTMHISRLVRA